MPAIDRSLSDCIHMPAIDRSLSDCRYDPSGPALPADWPLPLEAEPPQPQRRASPRSVRSSPRSVRPSPQSVRPSPQFSHLRTGELAPSPVSENKALQSGLSKLKKVTDSSFLIQNSSHVIQNLSYLLQISSRLMKSSSFLMRHSSSLIKPFMIVCR